MPEEYRSDDYVPYSEISLLDRCKNAKFSSLDWLLAQYPEMDDSHLNVLRVAVLKDLKQRFPTIFNSEAMRAHYTDRTLVTGIPKPGS